MRWVNETFSISRQIKLIEFGFLGFIGMYFAQFWRTIQAEEVSKKVQSILKENAYEGGQH